VVNPAWLHYNEALLLDCSRFPKTNISNEWPQDAGHGIVPPVPRGRLAGKSVLR
jgi:hypothetical protein